MRTYKRALLAVWLCIFVMVGLLALIASESSACPGHRPSRIPPHHTMNGEILIPSQFRSKHSSLEATPKSQSFLLEPVNIPGAAPYWGKVRYLQRIDFPFVAIWQLLETTAKVKAPEIQPVTFELLRSGAVVYQTPLTDAKVGANEVLGFTAAYYQGVLDTDFVNPIAIAAGQSLSWRVSMPFTANEETAKGEEIFLQFDLAYRFQNLTIGVTPATGTISYAEDWPSAPALPPWNQR